MTKICCVYHSVDLDGYMSAAIVKHWWKTLYFDYNNVHQTEEKDSLLLIGNFSNEEQERLDFIGYNYGQPIPDLTGYDKVIMCDISFDFEDMKKLAFTLESNNTDKFIWLDHHISSIEKMYGFMWNYNHIKGLQDTNYAACELTWKYFFPDSPMPEIVRLLGRYDCFGHKGTDEEFRVLEFQYGARSVIGNVEQAYNYLKKSIDYSLDLHWNTPFEISPEEHIKALGVGIYSYLCTEAKQKFEHRFTLEFGEYYFAAINAERFNPINFGIDYHSYKADDIYFYDGVACFWITPDGVKFSLYNDNGKVDCSKICASFGGGGHKGAAGFFMPFYNKIDDSIAIQDFKSKLGSILYVGSKRK